MDQQPTEQLTDDKRQGRRRASRATGNITLADVAKIAGVSAITVSRAVNRPEMVTPATLTQVQQAIARTGYVPNLLAGALASNRTRLVAAIVPSITNTVFVDTIQALTDRLWEAGYQVLLGLSGYPAVREEDLLSAVLSRRPDAICLTGIDHSLAVRQRLFAAKVPVVETWDFTPTPIDMLVGFSHEEVGRAVARRLVDKGHRVVGMIWADDARALERRRGFQSELASSQITDVNVATLPAPSTFAMGRRGLASLLEAGARPTAVFCSSDLLAHGALEEARCRGLRVPDDLALVGFGDLDFGLHTAPALSTVRVDRAAIGRRAAELILGRLHGDQAGPAVVDVRFEIVERGTS